MSLDEREQRLVDDIERVGWHLIGVDHSQHGPSFVYSIGMQVTLGHPEIIIFGLDVRLMAKVVNNMGADIRSGRSFVEPLLYEGLLEKYACKTAPVAKKFHKSYFGFALWHRRHIGHSGTLEAIQCFWPDKAGLFPDEDGCHPSIVTLQPRLQ